MLRNKEFRLIFILYIAIAAAGISAGFVIGIGSGILALVLSGTLGVAFFLFTKARYRSIARMSKQIDIVLHDINRLDFGEANEGELSILYSDITKMTLRIRAQNDALKNDKQYLADSLADIAHQLRTPLTSVNLILSLLSKNPDEEARVAFVREIEGLLIRMDWLITALLKLSRIDAGVIEFQNAPVAVGNMIRSALMPLAIAMELRGIYSEINIPPDVMINGDEEWLTEAVQNIIKNCVDNTPEDGTLEITCTDTNLYTEIIIHDSGAGFDAEDLPHLFDRFYRGKNANATGYGIGLALCKMIITRQGGSVTAKNYSGGGAVFAIRFPKVTNQSL